MRTTYIKFIILGDAATGKSSLLRYFAQDRAFLQSEATIGLDFLKKSITDEQYGNIEFSLWDTSGAERFHIASLTQAYYRNAQGIILCFDITNRASFNNVSLRWLSRLRTAISDMNRCKCVLVGNKSDLMANREVSEEEALSMAVQNHMHYVELSSLESEVNLIRKPFLLLARQLIREGICNPVYKTLPPKQTVVVLNDSVDGESECCS